MVLFLFLKLEDIVLKNGFQDYGLFVYIHQKWMI